MSSLCLARAELMLLNLDSIPTPAPTGLIGSAIINSNRRGEVEVMLGCRVCVERGAGVGRIKIHCLRIEIVKQIKGFLLESIGWTGR